MPNFDAMGRKEGRLHTILIKYLFIMFVIEANTGRLYIIFKRQLLVLVFIERKTKYYVHNYS